MLPLAACARCYRAREEDKKRRGGASAFSWVFLFLLFPAGGAFRCFCFFFSFSGDRRNRWGPSYRMARPFWDLLLVLGGGGNQNGCCLLKAASGVVAGFSRGIWAPRNGCGGPFSFPFNPPTQQQRDTSQKRNHTKTPPWAEIGLALSICLGHLCVCVCVRV